MGNAFRPGGRIPYHGRMRTGAPIPLLLFSLLAPACAAESPTGGTTPDERCVAAHDQIGTCIDAYCATAAADDPMCTGGADYALDGSCDERTASQADRFIGQDCSAIIADLQINGGKADGWCPSFLCWLCDCEEEQADCCIDCGADPVDEATCRGCFDIYGHDSDDDGVNDRVWVLYCTGRCAGCVDSDCDGECDPAL